MARKTGLGRGLDALIPSPESTLPAGGVIYIPIHQIDPNPRQPRHSIDVQEVEGLAESIRDHGVIQPLIVTYDEETNRYTLIAGARRWVAARLAGLETVPAILRHASEQGRLELALIENIQRMDLAPLEAAEAYRQLAEDFGLSHEEISERVHKNRTTITNTLRLLKLPENVQQALAEGRISEGHARTLLALTTPQTQTIALQAILTHQLSVRQTERLIRKLNTGQVVQRPKPSQTPELHALEERLRSHLGTRVTLKRSRKGGTLIIHFFSDEELDALINQLLGEADALR